MSFLKLELKTTLHDTEITAGLFPMSPITIQHFNPHMHTL